MDLWLSDIRRNLDTTFGAELDELAPDLRTRYTALSERLRLAQAREIESGRPWLLPGQKTEFGDTQREIQKELESVRNAMTVLAAEIRAVVGYDLLAPEQHHIEDAAFALDRPIVYLGISEWGGFAIVLKAGEPPHIVLDDSYVHDDLVRFLSSVDDGGGGYSDGQLGDARSLRHAVSRLDQVAPDLIHQLDTHLATRGGRAIFVPAGALALLPIHALGSSPTAVTSSISYTTSLASLKRASRDKRDQARPLRYLGVLGDQRGLREDNGKRELQSAAACFGAEGVVLGGDDSASTAAALMGSSEIIHFVGHGEFDLGEPHRAAIRFKDGSTLEFADIYRRTDLTDVALVVVSACKTAVRARIPAESISLASSFLSAGARCVLGTLWAADDVASTLLVSRFFEEHFGEDEGDFSRSLQRAQQWLRDATRVELTSYWRGHGWEVPPKTLAHGQEEERPFSSPTYWASYVVLGNPLGTWERRSA